MKNKKIIIPLVLAIVLVGIILINYDNTEGTVLMDEEKKIVSSSSISMMLETGASTGIYEASTDTAWPTSGYTFNDSLSSCENGSTLTWDSTNGSITVSGNVSDKCYIYFDVELVVLASTITYIADGENNFYYFDGEGDYTNASLEAVDYSYRYAGASDSTNNFVCFGSDSETCETDNLYRIIGFFLNDAGEYEMKMIKWDYANSDLLGTTGDYGTNTYSASSYSNYTGSHDTINRYYWSKVNISASNSNSGYFNDWSYSQLNTVNLNDYYYNSLESTWQDMISTHTWIVGGMDDDSSATGAGYYATEIASSSSQLGYTTYDAKVGLMYVSDYGFAAAPTYWNVAIYSYVTEARQYDWMYMGVDEWIISRTSSNNYFAFLLSAGIVLGYYIDDPNAIRPCFYLESFVQISSGSGTQSDPYRLQT